MDPELHLSFVIPVYNEEATIEPLFEGISKAVENASLGTFETIFIDDGSRDGSWGSISELNREYPQLVRGIRLRRNMGKATALQAAFNQARGKTILTMDADLQDEPSEIANFIRKLDEGYDAVSGWKQLRQDPLSKTLPSRFFNFATRVASGVNLHDFNCGFKAYRKEAIHNLDLYGELHRYIPVLLDAEGFSVAEIPVSHNRRTHGVSKYGWTRLVKGCIDLVTVIVITRYLKRPGHFFGGFGLLSGVLGFGVLSWLSIQKIAFGASIGNRPLLFLGILLLIFGVQLVSTGLIGELLNFNSGNKGRLQESIEEKL